MREQRDGIDRQIISAVEQSEITKHAAIEASLLLGLGFGHDDAKGILLFEAGANHQIQLVALGFWNFGKNLLVEESQRMRIEGRGHFRKEQPEKLYKENPQEFFEQTIVCFHQENIEQNSNSEQRIFAVPSAL
jgi:hypothetical protein